MPEAVAIVDDRHRFVWVNRAMASFLTCSRESIVGRTCHGLIHGTATPPEFCLFRKVKETRRREEAELELAGIGVWLRVSADPLLDGAGHVVGAIHYLSDITQARRARDATARGNELAGRLLSLMDNLPGVVYRGMRDWSLAFIGADVERITGYTAGEFLSGDAKWRDLIHPDDLERVKHVFRDAVRRKEKVLHVEYRAVHKNGTLRWLSDRRQLLYDDAGEFAYVDGLLLDDTARRKAEEGLQETLANLHALIAASPLPIMALTPDGFVTLWNPAAERVFGWTLEEAIGKFNPMVPEDKRNEFSLLRERVLRKGGFSGVEIVRKKKDGAPITISLSTAPLRGGDGSINGIMAVMEDITARKQVEEAIVLERDFSDAALNSLPGIFYLFDEEGKFLRWNRNFEQVTEYSPEEIGRMHPLDLFDQPDKELIRERITEVFDKGASVAEAELVSRSGKRIPHYFTGQIFHWKGRLCLIGTGIDATDRKKLEEQLQQSQKIEAVGRLAGGVAHDFNNLLTGIRGYSDLLLHRIGPDSPMRRDVEEIQKAGERATSLTRQLLAFSRKQMLQPKVMDLNAVVAGMDRMLRRLIGEDIDLVTVLKPNLWSVLVDPGQVEQVIMNLVVNSRDAMPDGGKVTIETANVELDSQYARRHADARPGEYVLLAISDTGVGMDEETKHRIFEPFFTTKEKGKGTGLGLSTVYGIVKQSGGYIWVYSEVGKGATFKVYFPRHAEADGPAKEMAPSGASLRGGETVLLVEDDEMVRSFVLQTLELSGYRVLTASNGDEAIEAASGHRGPVHLLLTDVVMPRMGGRQLVESLSGRLPGLKVLYMSGYTDDAIVHHGVLEPGTPFLQKPFSPEGLLRKVREVLSGASEKIDRGHT